jgi:hypothetical protein
VIPVAVDAVAVEGAVLEVEAAEVVMIAIAELA